MWLRVLLLALALSALACKKEEAPRGDAPSAGSELRGRLLGRWNDKEDGTLAWEFLADGKCRVFGNMDCQYQVVSESGKLLVLRYQALDSWEDVEVTFHDADRATWKSLTVAKTEPESATTELTRAK